MDGQKIVLVVEMYEARLRHAGVPKVQMDENQTFGDLGPVEALMHAHYLCDGVKQFAMDPERQRKTGSHLTSVQICLSIAGWYTLKELKDHNRP